MEGKDLGRSTAWDLLNKATLPRQDTVEAFVVACRAHYRQDRRRARGAEVTEARFDLAKWAEMFMEEIRPLRSETPSLSNGRGAARDITDPEFHQALTLLSSERTLDRQSGVTAVATLADNRAGLRQACIDLLCSHLRVDPGPGRWPEHDKVRYTIQHTLQDRMRPDSEGVRWTPYNIDLTGAHLHDVDFTNVIFTGDITFTNAVFSGWAHFGGARFKSGGNFDGARFEGPTRFGAARFGDQGLEVIASFRRARFLEPSSTGGAWFGGAHFFGAARFEEAEFAGLAMFAKATFHGIVGFTAASFAIEPEVAGMKVENHPELNGTSFTTWPGPNHAHRINE